MDDFGTDMEEKQLEYRLNPDKFVQEEHKWTFLINLGICFFIIWLLS